MIFAGNDTTQSSDAGIVDLPLPYHAAPSPQPQTPALHRNTTLSLTLNAFFLAYLGGERCYATVSRDAFAVDGYGYVQEQDGGGVREAWLGMFHQLECLHQMLWAPRGQAEKKRKDSVVDEQDDQGEAQWDRCFDYLRQVVLCGADDTVEVSDGVGGGWESFGDGGVGRQCRGRGRYIHQEGRIAGAG
ncbi:hypothetical protein PSPO01_12109 [Paraphaeosphaeria sporulosa]